MDEVQKHNPFSTLSDWLGKLIISV